MTAPHMQLTGVDKLIMAAQMESNQPIPPTMPFYFREPPQIPTPRNKSELELYQLLRRANLLDYFPTFLRYGGDDVQQLADANEEEFLEIVEMIGMHQKPLHVRRLEKTLAMWRTSKLSGALAHSAPAADGRQQAGYFYDTAGFYANHAASATSATSNLPTATPGANNSRADLSFRSDLTQCSSSLLDESFGPPASSASRSLFPVNQDDLKPKGSDTPMQYCTPHEVFRNAPKRPRLMDSIKPSDLTKGIQMYDSSVHSTPVRHPPSARARRQDPNEPSDSEAATPAEKRHPIQISPPDSAKSDSDDSSCYAKSRSRVRRKAQPTKSKI